MALVLNNLAVKPAKLLVLHRDI